MSKLENQEVSEESGEEIQEEEQSQVAALAEIQAEQQKARGTGWVPESEFRGKKENWRPAAEWNEYGDKHIPFIKAELRGTKEENAALKEKLGSLESVVEKMTTVQDKFGEDSYNKSISDIKTQRREAAGREDWEEYDRLEEQEAQIVKPAPVAETEPESNEQTQAIPPHPEAVKFMEAESWFNADPQLQKYAYYIGQELNKNKDPDAAPGQEKAFYARVAREVKTMFPHKFTNPNQDKSDIVEPTLRGGGTPPSGNGAKGWDDLPAVAKQQCAKMMAEDKEYTKEEYVKHYPFDDEE